MSNFTSTIEYKFKVTNNLDKTDARQKKFNFYLGLPYSKRKYRYMQVINFATNKEGQHLFNVILGHSESSVAAMTEDILRGTRASLEPVTKVMRITYASVNIGQTSILYNDANKKTLDTGDWTGISGEYMKIKSFRTNGNDEVLGLIFDAADRSVVSARKNDGTNVVAKPEAPADKPTNGSVELKLDPELLWKAHQKLIGEYGTLKMMKEELEQRVKGLTEINEGFKKDLDKRDADISALMNQLEERDQRIKTLTEERVFKDKNIEDLTKKNAELHNQQQFKPFSECISNSINKLFSEGLFSFVRLTIDELLSDDELLMKGTKL